MHPFARSLQRLALYLTAWFLVGLLLSGLLWLWRPAIAFGRVLVGPRAPATVEEPVLKDFAMWRRSVIRVVSQNFRGGEAAAFMGGVEIDLRQAKPAKGGAVLDVFVCWGGVDLKVSENWRVVNQATVLLGGIDDKSKGPSPDARDLLIVRGLVAMGGLEIRN